jgi:hypothetical protein
MQHHVQPVVKPLGVDKRVSHDTSRYTSTTLMVARERNVKVGQELLRHASSKTALDLNKYAQAGPATKHRAQNRIVRDLRRSERIDQARLR